MPPTQKKKCWWVALKLFFVYIKLGIANSVQQMAKQHATTLRFKVDSVDRLVNVIWGDDWDVKYFVNNSTKMSFGKLIHDMYDPNPEAQIIVHHVVRTLVGPPYNWTALEKCC
jgi:hypothetical protein